MKKKKTLLCTQNQVSANQGFDSSLIWETSFLSIDILSEKRHNLQNHYMSILEASNSTKQERKNI